MEKEGRGRIKKKGNERRREGEMIDRNREGT